MMVGPDKAISGPNEPPPVKPGHRGQLARLIRERLVFVNLPGNVRRSEVGDLRAATLARDLQIEKRYSNHKLAGIHEFPKGAKKRLLRRFRNVGAWAAFEGLDCGHSPPQTALAVFFQRRMAIHAARP
jgi:hypothetical protein